MLMQNYSVISYRVFGNRIVVKRGFYAHSVEGKPVSQWHRLEEHLKGTAEPAKSCADEFE